MKNTYLVALLFLCLGLVMGQFLNLNIKKQESTVIKAEVNKNYDEKLKPFEKFQIIEIPSGERQYACWSNSGGPIFISTNGDDSGSVTIGGVTWSCYAITFNLA